MNHKGIIGIAIALLVGGMASYIFVDRPIEGLAGASGAHTERGCRVETQAQVEVGPDLASELLATSSTRAWAVIKFPELVNDSTTTPYLSFDQGIDAVIGTGYPLIASSTDQEIRFGLKTEFPYLSAVSGIKATGSTTLQVIECNY